MRDRAFSFSTLAGCILLFPVAGQGFAKADPAGAGPETTRKVLAVVDAQVVTMESPRVLAHQTVIIRDGRITEIGLASDTKSLEGALRIEARGKYLMPGVIDCFCHVDGVGTLIPASRQRIV